jgi:RNA polymerase sigma-70 factor, ECF subfamily
MKHKSVDAGDIAVIDDILSGHVNAFEVLVKRYQAHVFSVVRKHVPTDQVKEVAHDVFIRAYQGLSGFSKKSSFKSWLSGISVRTCYDFWRKKYRSKEIPLSRLTEAHREWLENTMATDAARATDETSRQAEATEVLDWALSRLSAADRMVMELVYLEGCSHKEAARLLAWSTANVKIRVYRAKKKLYHLIMAEKAITRGNHENLS